MGLIGDSRVLVSVFRPVAFLFSMVASYSSAVDSFAPIDLPDPATAFALTEDGKQLVVAHHEVGKVSVIDLATGIIAKTLNCPSARAVLCRGGTVYVLKSEPGTIAVFSLKDWKMADELLVGDKQAYYLSAAQGTKFDGHILITAGTYTDHRILLMDTKKDQCKQVRKEIYMSVATVNAAGDTVFIQGDQSSSPSGAVTVFPFAKFGEAGVYGEHVDTAFLSQCQEGSFWIGGGRIYMGKPPRALAVGGPLAPQDSGTATQLWTAMDQLQRRLYAITPSAVTAFGMSTSTPMQGSVALTSPTTAQMSDELRQWRHSVDAVAATIDGATYLVIPGSVAGTLMRAVVRFDALATSAAAPSGGISGGLDDEFPGKVVEGVLVTRRIGAKGTYEVAIGPKGLAVSGDGVLTWTPDASSLGAQQIKIKAEVGGEVSFKRFSCDVLPKEAAGIIGDPDKLRLLGNHPLATDAYDMSLGVGGHVLLLQDQELSIIDANGQAASQVQLPSAYRFVRERDHQWIGVDDEKLDLIDKTSLKVVKSIPLGCRKVNSIALHPKQGVTFVSGDYGKGNHDINGMRIVIVDEAAGTVSKPEHFYGNLLVVHPSGSTVFAAVRDLMSADFTVLGLYGDATTYSSYQSVDYLLSYDVIGKSVKTRNFNPTPGANGSSVVINPDGKWVSYVSGGGYRRGEGGAKFGYCVPSFTSEDIRKAPISYETGAYPRSFAYHPTLPLVAGTDGNRPMIFDQKTGANLTDRLDLGTETIAEVKGLMFTPGGQHLLVVQSDGKGSRSVHAYSLRLNDAERAQLKSPAEVAPLKQGGDVPVASPRPNAPTAKITDFDALQGTGVGDMTTADIAKRMENAVVLIENGDGSASGFFVGRNGWVLTCAHALHGNPDQVVVRYKMRKDGAVVSMKDDSAAIVAVDQALDIALLKIKATEGLQVVRLPANGAIAMGDRVCIIGNPGGGGRILDSTMTEGIVSNPRRDLEGQDYIQTTAAINPGSSGSPMFNAKGSVIGLVVLKATDAEATGFAIPRDRLIKFLRRAAGEKQP